MLSSGVLVLAMVGVAGVDWWGSGVSESLDRAPERKGVWEKALKGVPEGWRGSVEYLVKYLPEGDLKAMDPEYLLANVALSEKARASVKWGKALPEEIYLDAVLPHASVTEPRVSMRKEFMDRYLDAVKDMGTPGEAALYMNKTIFKDYKVGYNTKRLRTDQASRETIDQGMATCTGLSVMLVEACRAVGVPARVAGITSWPVRGGNHTWVEIWDAGRWHYVGAAEPDAKGLNHAWFGGDAAKAIKSVPENAIYAVSYKETGENWPLAWDPGTAIHAVNVTDRYTAGVQAPGGPRLMVMVREDGERTVAEVAAFSVATGEKVIGGKSLGPGTDINLHLNGLVKAGEYWVLGRKGEDWSVWKGSLADDLVVTLELETRGMVKELLAERFGEDEKAREVAAKVLAELPVIEGSKEMVEEAWRAGDHGSLKAEFDAKRVETDLRKAPYLWRTVGTKPEKGWGLVIAMHGGGGTTKEFNDQQWQGMFRYYAEHPEAGGYVYLSLRAPNDTWNGFYDDAICPMVERLIKQFVLFGEVDPDRVYALGASHGGYGAFVIGPKVPYRFAAVHSGAAAGTDGETFGQNLKALRFTHALGSEDKAYGRAERNLAFREKVAEWEKEFGDYDYELYWFDGVGHGIRQQDGDRVGEMRKYERNVWPKHLVWRQSDDVINRFYWVESLSPREAGFIEAKVVGQTIELKTENQGRLHLWLDSRMIDLSKEVVVKRNGEEVYRTMPRATMGALAESMAATGDPVMMSGVRLEIGE